MPDKRMLQYASQAKTLAMKRAAATTMPDSDVSMQEAGTSAEGTGTAAAGAGNLHSAGDCNFGRNG